MAENRRSAAVDPILEPLAGRRAATTVTAGDEAVRDHLVHSVPVLPGVFLLDMILRLVKRAGTDPARVELRRILFLAPVVGTDAGHRVEVVIGEAGAGAGLPVTVRSRPADAPDAGWVVNCQAEIHGLRHPATGSVPAERLVAGAAPGRTVDVDDLYAFVRRLEILHRGFMKASGTVRVGRDHALARMRLAPGAEPYTEHFHAHPAVLDFATLVPLLLFGQEQRTAADHAFIPIAIDSFHVSGPIGAENLVHVPGPVGGRLDADLFHADLEICAPDGSVAARLTGFRAKRVRSADLITAPRAATQVPVVSRAPDGPTAAARRPAGGPFEAVTALVGERLGRPADTVDPELGFYDLGLTSVDLLAIARGLEDRLGTELYPTLLFEHSTVRALADHLAGRPGDQGHGEAASGDPERAGNTTDAGESRHATHALPTYSSPVAATVTTVPPADAAGPGEPLAIVGLAGRYPGAGTPDELWQVLLEGRDCVTDVPADRWDHSAYFDPRRGTSGRTYGKWGAFCEGVAEFDAPFFHLSSRQAELMDPHERLFLQTAWAALEDAGHSPEGLAAQTGGAVGVFAGAMWNDYQLNGLDRLREGTPEIAGSWSSALANRVSYTFDFQGPSITVDTACSAALTALHLAAESIRRGECRAAVVGGVNFSLHPYKYLRLAELGLLSSDGRCRPFGKDADGYVPGEGVGAVVIRPLAEALASGDHVYGLIRGSALRHSGRTGGYSVPSPEAQARVVSAALADAGVPARTVTLLEAHASGTALGDQIEIEALTSVYGQGTGDRGFCAVGSVKTSIGHLEAAAGIAGLTKLLLCLRHRTIPAARDTGPLNPAIRFEDTPFRLPAATEPWQAQTDPETGLPLPRRAALSAFGAGGAGVHLIVEEYAGDHLVAATYAGPWAVPLSARTEDQLRETAGRLARHLREHPALDLADVAHTLRTGRRPMAHRLAVTVASSRELAEALEEFAAGRTPRTAWHQGLVHQAGGLVGAAGVDAAGLSQEVLAEQWTSGTLRTWPAVRGARRAALPTYPFSRDRHWLDGQDTTPSPSPARPVAQTLLYVPRRCEARSQAMAPATPDVVVAFDTDAERIAELRVRCRRVVQVRPGVAYARLDPDLYEISPGEAEHHRMLAEALREEKVTPAALLHLWGLRTAGHAAADDTAGLVSAFLLCRAWAQGLTGRLPVVYAYADDHGDAETPGHAAVGGLARSVRLEQPALALTTVRFDTGGAPVTALLAEARAAADDSAAPVTEVRYQGGKRTRRVFRPLDPAAADAVPPVPLVRPGGHYLISGGAGGLGRHTARLLASRGAGAVVLLGRSARGPVADAAVAELEAAGTRAAYLRADVTDLTATERAVAETTRRFGPLTGVVHAAGVVEDALLLGKDRAALERVLAPKARGAVCLDRATRDAELDYLLLYSSAASVLGNAGATDYAAANRFLDSFATWREEHRQAGERHGRTLSVNWPLWRDGGMRLDPEAQDLVLGRLGAEPLPTADALTALEAAWGSGETQVVVLHGDRTRLERHLDLTEQAAAPASDPAHPAATPAPGSAETVTTPVPGHGDLAARAAGWIAGTVRELLGVDGPVHGAGFMELGLTSVQLVELVRRIGDRFAVELPATAVFLHPDVESLAAHLAAGHRDTLAAALAPAASRSEATPETATGPAAFVPDAAPAAPAPEPPPAPGAGHRTPADEPIAVIGMAGRFPASPGSHGTTGLWADLLAGRDLITPVPADRWDHRLHHDPTGARPDGTDCGHGAFLDDVRRFDAAFFGVHRAQAEGMDPQARLLLEVLYEAAEDAGAAGRLRGSATGTFLGRCFSDYEDEMTSRGRRMGAHEVTGTSVSMAANLPSHVLDLTGPSMVVDTACSSSLYALHLAVEALRRGDCPMAFAAGTNLILGPEHYLRSSALGALSPSGRCHTFDARADGYVPGEAVAAVLLKPLSAALADGDPVQAVIRSVAVSHGGRAASVTAPHPGRQTELLLRAWEQAGIDPETLTYLEAHGTGTALGDPIEVEAVTAAFRAHTTRTGFCAVGSAKAHLGHTEGAAGLVGVIKTVLSMRHGVLPAMPDFRTPNPHCAFEGSALALHDRTVPWHTPSGVPRRAGVSSFGFGGAYAHAVLEEAPAAVGAARVPGPYVFPFSARDEDALRRLVARHRAFLEEQPDLRPDEVSATLCRGREAMAARLAVVAGSLPELLVRLDEFLAGTSEAADVPGADRHPQAGAVRRWAAGEDVELPVPDRRLRRLPLPGYPFGGERYWFEDTPAAGPEQEPEPEPRPRTGRQSGAESPEPRTRAGRAAEEVARFVAGTSFAGRRARSGMDRLDELLRRWCRHLLGESSAAQLRARLADEQRYGRLADALARVIARTQGRHAGSPAGEQRWLDGESAALASEHPELTPWLDLVKACVPRLPEVLAGSADALEVFFSPDHPDLLLRIYDGNAVADHHNEIVARAVAALVRAARERAPGRPVRLLEIGGGTGGTTRRVLDVLAEHGDAVHYTFTDVSPAFLPAARTRFGKSPVHFECRVLDLDADPESQGFVPGSADVVIAANSVHATRTMADSLARIRRLLAPGGALVLEELVRNRDCMTPMIGPLPGYWSSTDPDVRLPHSPFLDVAGWRTALGAQGFQYTWAFGAADLAEAEFDNAVLIGCVPEDATVPAPAPVLPTSAVPAPATEAAASAGAVPDTAPEPDATEIRERLRGVFARFFGLAEEAVDPQASFDTLGMDSLSAIQLVRGLEADFGKLPKVLLYEQPTIAALAEYLAAHAPARFAAPAAPAPDTVTAAPASPAPVTVTAPPALPASPGRGTPDDDPVAIVGMAGRYAKSPDLTAWWRNLRDGVHLVTEIPEDRFDWREVFGDPYRSPGKVNSRWGSFIDGVDRFDAQFFGMTPLEAELMDPQQRVMLETAWQAVEDSGHRPGALRGSRTGVFIGATSRDYDWQLHRAGRHREGHVVSGNGHCLIANRISYQLDLRGPSEAVDTACSSSLTALHRAVRAIRTGECDAALAGGVHLFLTPDLFVALGQLGIMSPDGRCAAFDRKANGMVRGEGAAAVLLKPLSRALADGDTVYALVRGSGVSHGGGGHMDSLMMPNPSAQAELIASVYREAGVDPRTIGYIEAHGTGTEVGDPIELRGLRKAFATLTGRSENEPVSPWCALGTVKSNVGHTEAAAGLTGVVKTVLALRHGMLPPTLHFSEPNPLLEIEDSPFRVVDRLTPWPSSGSPRRAGVSAFGLGGTNAHVLLEEYAQTADGTAKPDGPRPEVIPLSARTPERLRAQVHRLHAFLTGQSAAAAPPVPLADLGHTLREGRDAMEYRLALVATSTDEVVRLLRAELDGTPDPSLVTGTAGSAGADVREEPAADPYAAARAWVTGGPNWRPRPGGRTPRRIPLPAYPFAPQRYWAEPTEPIEPAEPTEQIRPAEPTGQIRPAEPTGQIRPAEPDVPAPAPAALPELLQALTDGRMSVEQVEESMEGVL
ncbi:SDR family NAD(P)-dependent oxidoreductase [Streptomyces sp. NPDC007883]|uniref:SDR family NAD(P)-dependent oxidoreductase n=1 Tax=Streptomyces sp. NPDC007883 TaxID=3155116 RepID=UPI0033C5B0DD